MSQALARDVPGVAVSPQRAVVVAIRGGACRKSFFAAVEEEGLELFLCVPLRVYVQVAALCKGFATARFRADKGLVSGMDPEVLLQGRAVCKGLVTVRVRAGTGHLSCMEPAVFLQGDFL